MYIRGICNCDTTGSNANMTKQAFRYVIDDDGIRMGISPISPNDNDYYWFMTYNDINVH